MNHLLRLLVVLLLLPLGAEARKVPFPKDNFSVELPREWQQETERKLKAPWGRIAMMAKAENGQFMLVGIQEMPEANIEKAQAHIKLLQEPALKQGWTVSELRETLIDGVPFYLFTITRKGADVPDVLLATTFTTQRAYTLQVGDPKGSVDEAPELDELVRSFRLLTPKTPLELTMAAPGAPVPVPAPALRLRWVIYAVLGFGAVILLVRWVMDQRSRRRRRERRRRRAEAAASGSKEPAPEA